MDGKERLLYSDFDRSRFLCRSHRGTTGGSGTFADTLGTAVGLRRTSYDRQRVCHDQCQMEVLDFRRLGEVRFDGLSWGR